jgi:hypothetical protein
MRESERIAESPDLSPYVYIPCIITTAELVVAKVDPLQVSLEDGTVSDFEYDTVDYIMFRKSLVTDLSTGAAPADLADSNKDKERTLLIVNSKNIDSTLEHVAVNLKRGMSPALW